MGQIRVLVVDDHEVVRSGLRTLIDSHADMKVVGEAGTAEEAVRRVGFDDPEIVILEVRLPDTSGVEACRRIRERFPEVRVLLLTSFADEQAILGAVMNGASGFLLKKVGGTELIEGLRSIADGESLMESVETQRILETIRLGPATDPRIARLSERELEVLHLVAEGLTNRQIAEETFLAEKTVKNYVSNMLAKMGFHRRSEAAAFMARREVAPMKSLEDWPATDG